MLSSLGIPSSQSTVGGFLFWLVDSSSSWWIPVSSWWIPFLIDGFLFSLVDSSFVLVMDFCSSWWIPVSCWWNPVSCWWIFVLVGGFLFSLVDSSFLLVVDFCSRWWTIPVLVGGFLCLFSLMDYCFTLVDFLLLLANLGCGRRPLQG
jgi:hypothetical protein